MRRVLTVVWDKNRQLPAGVCEAALRPTSGATSLLFPVDDTVLDQADPVALARRPRWYAMVYVGNQNDRDEVFTTYYATAAAGRDDCMVAGMAQRTSLALGEVHRPSRSLRSPKSTTTR